MKNWLGQEISPGDVVYRGARQGNSSEFKIGVVKKFGKNNTVTVEWHYEDRTAWWIVDRNGKRPDVTPRVPHRAGYYSADEPLQTGSPNINTVIRVDKSLLRQVQCLYEAYEEAKNLKVPFEDIDVFITQFAQSWAERNQNEPDLQGSSKP